MHYFGLLLYPHGKVLARYSQENFFFKQIQTIIIINNADYYGYLILKIKTVLKNKSYYTIYKLLKTIQNKQIIKHIKITYTISFKHSTYKHIQKHITTKNKQKINSTHLQMQHTEHSWTSNEIVKVKHWCCR